MPNYPRHPSRSARSSATSASLGLLLGFLLICVAPRPALAALSCTAQTQAVAFGSYQSGSVLPTDSSGAVEVKCACSGLECLAVGYTIEIGAGASGSVTDRRLRRAGETSDGLKYQLYRDVTRLLPWDVGANKASVIYLLNLFGSWQSTPVYGRLPPGQAVASGAYSDAPSILITY